MSGVGSPAFLPPADFVRSPEALAARLAAEEAPRLHALAGHPSLREFPRGQLPAAQAPAPGFLQRLRVLPLGGRSGRRDRRHGGEPAPARLVARRTATPCTRAAPAIRCSSRCAAPSRSYGIPARAVRRSDRRLRAGPDRDALSQLGTSCSAIAAIRRIRWAAWCSICAATRDAERQRLSDATCTALQLANFWQDVTVDLLKDRVYIPLEVLERHGYTRGGTLRARASRRRFARRCARSWTRRASCSSKGLPLAGMVDRRLALDLDLFSRGGMRVLEKIEQQGYDVLARASGDLQGGARRTAARRRWRAWRSRTGGVMTRSTQSYAVLRARGAQPRQELLLFVPAALARSSARPCARSTPSCATATI